MEGPPWEQQGAGCSGERHQLDEPVRRGGTAHSRWHGQGRGGPGKVYPAGKQSLRNSGALTPRVISTLGRVYWPFLYQLQILAPLSSPNQILKV